METEELAVAPASLHPRVVPLLALVSLWLVTTFGLGWAVVQGYHGLGVLGLPSMVLGLALAAAVVWGLPGASFAALPLRVSRRRFLLTWVAAVLVLVGPGMVTTNPGQYLAIMIAVAMATTVLLRSSLSRGEIAYALGLALIAGIAGLGSGRNAVYMPTPIWGLLQVGLTFFGFLAGWATMRRLGLFDRGMGRVLLLTEGPRAALRGVAEGMLLALPFTLLGIALGSTDTEGWVTSWWQTLLALQPGIAEDAWGRVFPLSLLMLVLVRAGSLRAAWLGALLAGVYWFANLHNFFLRAGGLTAVISALLAGISRPPMLKASTWPSRAAKSLKSKAACVTGGGTGGGVMSCMVILLR